MKCWCVEYLSSVVLVSYRTKQEKIVIFYSLMCYFTGIINSICLTAESVDCFVEMK